MAHLSIKEIGPLKTIELDLNKVNIFMGPQSSGKSTIAKIITFCHWVEKNVCLLRNYDDIQSDTYTYFEDYFNLQNYANDNSSIAYNSDLVTISYDGKQKKVKILPIMAKDYYQTYKRSKILYIPAERNIISTIPSWFSLKLPNNSLKTFMEEWGEARTIYNREKPLNVFPLNFMYYYDDSSSTDYVSIPHAKNKKYISLTSSSSGIQSSLPLYLLFKAYCQDRELLNASSSNEDSATLDSVYKKYLHYHTTVRYPSPIPESDQFRYKGKYYVVEPDKKEWALQILDNFTETQFIQGVIEEPELNLFPETQQRLVYELIHNIIDNENQLTMTTHSPYILFALNNCVMGGLVGQKIPDSKKKEFPSYQSWIDPKSVTIYEIHDGEIRCIQDRDGIMEDNYLNQAYKENSTEYLSLLNYYDDEE